MPVPVNVSAVIDPLALVSATRLSMLEELLFVYHVPSYVTLGSVWITRVTVDCARHTVASSVKTAARIEHDSAFDPGARIEHDSAFDPGARMVRVGTRLNMPRLNMELSLAGRLPSGSCPCLFRGEPASVR